MALCRIVQVTVPPLSRPNHPSAVDLVRYPPRMAARLPLRPTNNAVITMRTRGPLAVNPPPITTTAAAIRNVAPFSYYVNLAGRSQTLQQTVLSPSLNLPSTRPPPSQPSSSATSMPNRPPLMVILSPQGPSQRPVRNNREYLVTLDSNIPSTSSQPKPRTVQSAVRPNVAPLYIVSQTTNVDANGQGSLRNPIVIEDRQSSILPQRRN